MDIRLRSCWQWLKILRTGPNKRHPEALPGICMEKIKVSPFEWAIMQAAIKKGADIDTDKYEERTKEEELQHRSDNLSEQFSKLRIKKENK